MANDKAKAGPRHAVPATAGKRVPPSRKGPRKRGESQQGARASKRGDDRRAPRSRPREQGASVGKRGDDRRAPRSRPRKQDESQQGARDIKLSSEAAAELEALTAPLRRYRGKDSSAKAKRDEPAADSSSARGAATSPDDADAGVRDAGKRRAAGGGRRDAGRGTGAAERGGAVERGGRGRRDAGRGGAAERGGRRSRGFADAAEGGGRGRRDAGRGGAAERGGRGRRDAGRGGAAERGGRGRRDDESGRRGAAGGGGRELEYSARSSLAQKGGPITQHGDEAAAAQLAAALAAADSDETNDLTHGFHTYPARMHPRLARELVARFSEPGHVVLDPFCGSGTVLVEAMVSGRKPQGVDLNPLALRISEVHCALRDQRARRRFERHLRQVADASEQRVRERARAHIAIDTHIQAFYQPHVLFELCGLREEIDEVPDEADQRALLIVFSSLLIKFSRKRADTSGDMVDKRIRKGLVTEFFERKGQELSMRWEALFDAVPREAFEARLLCGDARELPRLLGSDFQADLIVSSPPYGGTYDYVRQHQIRNAWFGFDTQHLQDSEIGARSVLARAPNAAERWDDELLATLRAMREVSSDDARILLWLGDAEIAGRRIPADQQVASLAPDAALTLRASAAQSRLDARGGPERAEHLLLLEPVPYRSGR